MENVQAIPCISVEHDRLGSAGASLRTPKCGTDLEYGATANHVHSGRTSLKVDV